MFNCASPFTQFIEILESRKLLADVPAGFTDAHVAGGLASPTAMALAPDGRIFVAQQAGAVRVIKNGQLLSQPFATLTVNSQNERGLGGIVLDPDFPNNGYVYVYYTATTPILHNRISRLTANGDVAAAGSETVIFDIPDLIGAINHMGGALHFGADGKLYAAIGNHDLTDPEPQQSIDNLYGKMLRLNPDGSIPSDNPFYNQTTGINRAIYAYGLRNPFTFAVQPGTGRIFINDVGENSWEEVNEGIPGANYGWPITEGPTSDPQFVSPFYAYPTSEGCAIVGGAFYNPQVEQFPSSYVGKYFFADLCGGWIRALDLNTREAATFATNVTAPVDIDVAPDGTMYYLQRGGGGSVRKITYPAPAEPAVTTAYFIYATAPHKLVFRFNSNVSASLGVDDLVLFNETTNQTTPPASIALDYDTSSDTATFTFPGYDGGVLPDGRYRATLLAAGISNGSGQQMAGDFVQTLFFLRADFNRDGRVSLADFNILAANFGRSGVTFAQGDSNYDDIVNLQDFNALASRFGVVV